MLDYIRFATLLTVAVVVEFSAAAVFINIGSGGVDVVVVVLMSVFLYF